MTEESDKDDQSQDEKMVITFSSAREACGGTLGRCLRVPRPKVNTETGSSSEDIRTKEVAQWDQI